MTPASDLVIGADGLGRPPWAARDPLLREYYDTEWGMPVTTEQGVLERLCLEGFQAGLSWATILRKRPAFRDAFAGFEPGTVAAFGDREIDRLMGDARIVRNRRKIEATIANARATLALRDDPALDPPEAGALELEPGLPVLVWSFQPARTPAPRTLAEIPTTSAESVALSRELKRRGFRFVGPTTMHALMEAIGVIDTHLVGSHRRGSSGVWAG
ncbi:DNA-3-methyladenine glycosylase I [Lolliginicoccus suaedae]|uniref:DNA-3-methyladenine glycosylase I n=1 Tax=Lolliginicoccus suaedae TaxID=2605429 RepID=UPI0011EBA6F4|nr:DNA-3-methyladenine glycosylase I [Lolliginicoccus suaedae]